MANVKAVTVITQFATDGNSGSIHVGDFGGLADADILVTSFSLNSDARQTHLPAVTQPAASSIAGGHATRDPVNDYWSDSPKNMPNTLYRHRFGYGRDTRELFEQPGLVPLAQGATGARWGNLDNNSGVLLSERLYPVESNNTLWQHGSFHDNGPGVEDNTYYASWYGTILQFRTDPLIASSADIKQTPIVTGEKTLRVVNFLLTAAPSPNSVKNPIDTDIFIRFGNFSSVFDPDTFVLYIDEVAQTGLVVEEFFAGLGGFNVTWNNTTQFEYDSRVDIRWEFRDTDVPSNLFVFWYPFYTVKDLAGPRVTGLVPPHGATNIAIDTTLQFEVEDFENGINIDSLVIFVNSVKVVHGETGILEVSQYKNKKGYTVRYTNNDPWLYGDLIPVSIFVQDSSKNDNETFFPYSFTTVDSTSPTLINTKPLACTVVVPVGTHVSVDIIDGGHGINKDSIVLSVEGIERGDQVILIPILHRDE